ncbi:Crp/Fnr family transcriptional regulator [Paracoccus niistensis]|uniref:Crp/Fnr family transcriptional regulator n=1 Tax=Paracoccus niistensis TaxID=632935 RepID=A0ABV6I731_9RHOB
MPGIDLHHAYPQLFSQSEAELVTSLQGPAATVRPRHKLAQAGVSVTACSYLLEGFAGRYRADHQGRRQLLGLLIPGDFVDLPTCRLGHSDHEIEALAPATVSALPHAAISALRQDAPDLYDKLWQVTLLDAAVERYWTFRNGRLTGRARIASLFAETLVRQYARGLCGLNGCPLPISQTDLAEACGMTPVHANRMLGELRQERICLFLDGRVEVMDLPRLFRQAQFDWDYLYLPPATAERLSQVAQGGAMTAPQGRLRQVAAQS